MSASEIDERVRAFLATYVNSVEQIEVLFLLRATADREWSADECSRELRSDLRWVQERLGDFTARGLLAVREVDAVVKYRYAPSTEDTRGLIDGVAKAYKERRVSVINLIYGKVESDAVSFAEAFTIIKRKGG